QNLSVKDMIVSNAQGEITGAYPFTSEARQSRVELNGHTVYAMCALDALAPAAMAQCNSRVISECAITQQAVIVELDNQKILNADAACDIFVGINWQAACSKTSCAASLCTEMIFLKGEDTARQWQTDDPSNRELFILPEALQFSADFFVPLIKKHPKQ
ncbi:MAG: alkylmercury lyase family protein, partial [Gammaproteobacteria bacterium]|nr:alkylmercury lyase family protein [Gammaproteobacteria bacterium]